MFRFLAAALALAGAAGPALARSGDPADPFVF